MSPTIITLAIYIVGILGGAYVGHKATKSYYDERIGLLLQLARIYYESKLSKYHTRRDEKGRFTKRV